MGSHFDASCVVYQNEHELGLQLEKVDRASFFLTTKLDPPTSWTSDMTYNASVVQIQDCLASHRVTYFDLLLVHYPLASCDANQEAWRAMEWAYGMGLAKAIGVSNWCPSTFECVAQTATVTPHVNQVRYHVGMGPDPGGIKSYCEERGIALQAYSPLGAGTTGHPRTPALISGDLVTSIGRRYRSPRSAAGAKYVLSTSETVSGAQVALRWIVQHGVMVAVESTSEAHLWADLGIFDWQLSDEDMATLDAAQAKLFPEHVPPYSFKCRE